tara:strand:+ start:236 stop:364 length:129 start_codon:yes stop_codon:yes gene_type:complete
LVSLEYFFHGQRSKEVVSLARARHRRLELEAFGAIIYWSERI